MKRLIVLAVLALGFVSAKADGPPVVQLWKRNGTTLSPKRAGDSVAMGTRVLLKPEVGSSLFLWTGPTEPSALSTDANTFGPGGAKVSGDTMAYADLVALWDTFVVANAFPGWGVVKKSLGLEQSGAYSVYAYTFTPLIYNKTVVISTGHHPTEWGSILAVWRFFYHASQGSPLLPRMTRYVVLPCVNSWGFRQATRQLVNSRGVNLNRNYPFQWESSTDATKGSGPLSEAETKLVHDFVIAENPSAVLDFHDVGPAGGLYPYPGVIPFASAGQKFALTERVLAYLSNGTPDLRGIDTNSPEPTFFGWAATIGAQAISAEANTSGGLTYGASGWMTREVAWVGNLILSFSQMDAERVQPACTTYTVPFSSPAFKANSATATFRLGTIPAKSRLDVQIKHTTQFTSGSVTGLTVALGDGTTADVYASAFQILTAPVADATVSNGSGSNPTSAAAHPLIATFAATGANLGNGSATNLTAGSVDISVCTRTLR